MIKLEDLKSCPFCGERKDLVDFKNAYGSGLNCIACRNCGMDGPPADTIAGARELWNGRVEIVPSNWIPTSENINSLPMPLRDYICDLETNCDPAGLVQENACLKETVKALEIKLEEKEKQNELK